MPYISVTPEIQAAMRVRDPYMEGDKFASQKLSSIAHTKQLKSYYRRAMREHPNCTKDWYTYASELELWQYLCKVYLKDFFGMSQANKTGS